MKLGVQTGCECPVASGKILKEFRVLSERLKMGPQLAIKEKEEEMIMMMDSKDARRR
jgi:hypothetical protein